MFRVNSSHSLAAYNNFAFDINGWARLCFIVFCCCCFFSLHFKFALRSIHFCFGCFFLLFSQIHCFFFRGGVLRYYVGRIASSTEPSFSAYLTVLALFCLSLPFFFHVHSNYELGRMYLTPYFILDFWLILIL